MSNETIDRLVSAAVMYGETHRAPDATCMRKARGVLETECASLRSDLDAARGALRVQNDLALERLERAVKAEGERDEARIQMIGLSEHAGAHLCRAEAAERALEEMKAERNEAREKTAGRECQLSRAWQRLAAAERALEEMRGALEGAVALVGSCGYLAVAYGAAATERAVNEALPRFRALFSPSPAPSAPSTPAAPEASPALLASALEDLISAAVDMGSCHEDGDSPCAHQHQADVDRLRAEVLVLAPLIAAPAAPSLPEEPQGVCSYCLRTVPAASLVPLIPPTNLICRDRLACMAADEKRPFPSPDAESPSTPAPSPSRGEDAAPPTMKEE
jgi:hypothetical protein